MEFSEALDYSLKINNLDPSELADRMGKHRSQISKWLNNRGGITKRSVREINRALQKCSIMETTDGWLVETETRAQQLIHSLNQADESIDAYKFEELTLDDHLQRIELAQKLIGSSLSALREYFDSNKS